ncbi:MAG TPA: imelysin family protein [Bacteroidia bacterium]|jgi:hypothetical protein|nr:imelysin family protein [Bacteroidia bacterium]
MFNKKSISIICLSLFSLLIVQCKKKSHDEDLNSGDSFDKEAMLANYADNIIFPAYTNFKYAVDSLDKTTDNFVKDPTPINLQALQVFFVKAYIRYQSVSTFELGPADGELFRSSANIFPCDTTKINSKISIGNFDLSTVSDIDAKGFPALDFLLFNSKQNSTIILSRFTTAGNAENAKKYLSTVVAELKHKSDVIYNGWSATGGNYIATFKNNLGSSVGSSLGLMINQFNLNFENLKNARVGIPLGKKSLGIIYPNKVEAFYSGQSFAMALEQIKSIEDVYLGRGANGIDGLGFEDYLIALKTEHPSGQLSDVIKAKISAIKQELLKFQGGVFSEMITQDPAQFENLYQQIFQLTVLIKVDMPSAFGVMITYEDNDGD